jgi:hypothetical protein
LTGGGDAQRSKTREGQASWLSRFLLRGELRLGVNGDGPNKAQQLPADGSYDLRFLLAGRRQFLVAGV